MGASDENTQRKGKDSWRTPVAQILSNSNWLVHTLLIGNSCWSYKNWSKLRWDRGAARLQSDTDTETSGTTQELSGWAQWSGCGWFTITGSVLTDIFMGGTVAGKIERGDNLQALTHLFSILPELVVHQLRLLNSLNTEVIHKIINLKNSHIQIHKKKLLVQGKW